jgi:serine/threonine protein kinase/outer membrane protein assembly factor BamB
MQSLAADDPQWIGSYRLLARLGSGGMGHVYFARSPGGRTTALKVVRPELAGDPTFRARFRREVESARRVSGVFTAPVLDADAEGPIPWLAVAYVPGPTLHEAIPAHGTMNEAGLRSLGAGLAEALVAVHRVGLIHRDLKPGNVLLAADGPKVIDFGISRAADGTILTAAGALVGSPGFMSPEQVVADGVLGPASDVFSLAATLVYAATGAGPFDGGPTSAILYRIVRELPRLDGLPAPLAPIMAACLDKDPSRRPTPQSLVDSLSTGDPIAWLTPSLQAELADRAQQAIALGAVPDPPPPLSDLRSNPQSPATPSRRRFVGATVGAVVGIATVGGAAAWALDRSPARPKPRLRPTGPPVLPLPKTTTPLWTYSSEEDENVLHFPVTLAGGTLCFAGIDLYGLDGATGRLKWAHSGHGGPGLGFSNGEPFSTTTTVYAMYDNATENELIASCDGATGEAWRLANLGSALQGSLITGATGTLACLFSGNSRNVDCISGVDLSGGRIAWTSPSNDYEDAAVGPGACYILTKGAVFAHDLATGSEIWRSYRNPSTGNDDRIRYSDGLVIVLADDGASVIALNSRSGSQVWKATIDDTASLLEVGGGISVVLSKDSIAAFDLRTGRLRWRTPGALDFNLYTTYDPLSVSESVVVAAYSQSAQGSGFVAMNAFDGKVRWRHLEPAGTKVEWGVVADAERVYGVPHSPGITPALKQKIYAFSA